MTGEHSVTFYTYPFDKPRFGFSQSSIALELRAMTVSSQKQNDFKLINPVNLKGFEIAQRSKKSCFLTFINNINIFIDCTQIYVLLTPIFFLIRL